MAVWRTKPSMAVWLCIPVVGALLRVSSYFPVVVMVEMPLEVILAQDNTNEEGRKGLFWSKRKHAKAYVSSMSG